MSDSLWPHGLGHARLPCPSLSPEVCSCSRPSSRWCHPTISSSVIPFSSCPQSFQHQGLFQWAGSSHQVTKVLELQLQHQSFQWIFRIDFPLGWTGLIFLLSKGFSRVFSSTTVQKRDLVINPILLMLCFLVFLSNLAWACLSCLSIIERICVFNILPNTSSCSPSWSNSLNFHWQLEALGLHFYFLWTVGWCYSVFLKLWHFDSW